MKNVYNWAIGGLVLGTCGGAACGYFGASEIAEPEYVALLCSCLFAPVGLLVGTLTGVFIASESQTHDR